MTLRPTPKKRYGGRHLSPASSPDETGPLLTLRAAVVLMATGIAATVVAVLTYLIGHSAPAAVLAGITAALTVFPQLNGTIGQ